MIPFSLLLEAARPRQWVKNGFVLAPLVFARKVGDPKALAAALGAFLCFCAVASSVYLINDLADRERDRIHPVKRNRPVASGRLPLSWAVTEALVLLLAGLVGALVLPGLGPGFLPFPLFYLVLNLAYSFRLKHLVILDVLSISLGFLVRVVAGGEAVGVPVSSWLLLCTLFVSLLLAILKRRAEIRGLHAASGAHRKVLDDYDPAFLEMLPGPLAAMTIMAYSLYTVDPVTVAKFGSRDLILTVPLVVYGVFRYLYLAWKRDLGGEPARLVLEDKGILLSLAAWLAACLLILYGKGPHL